LLLLTSLRFDSIWHQKEKAQKLVFCLETESASTWPEARVSLGEIFVDLQALTPNSFYTNPAFKNKSVEIPIQA